MATLHIHLDESGNFVFNPKGTRFYIFTVAWTYNPNALAADLAALRFQLIKDGHFRPGLIDDLSGFHACDDPKPRRDAVINILRSHADWNFAAIVVEKNRVNAAIYDPKEFYSKFLTSVLKFVLRGRVRPNTAQVLIYTDTLPMPNKTECAAVNATIKSACNSVLGGKPFKIMHHPRQSNYWLQVADYCSWAVCRKWEFNDLVPYELLRIRLAATEIDPMSRGDGKTYY